MKELKNLNGVKPLNKIEQKGIKGSIGGAGNCGACLSDDDCGGCIEISFTQLSVCDNFRCREA